MTKRKVSPNSGFEANPVTATPATATAANSTSTAEKAPNPNASRLRDNQRRSRARKKEYLAALEAKYQECRRKGVEASVELQNAAKSVVRENQRLKELLRKMGVGDEEIDRWIKDGDLVLGATERVAFGLKPKRCTDGGFVPLKRTGMASRRSSTGGLYAKGGSTLAHSQPTALSPQDSNGETTSPISPKQASLLLPQADSPSTRVAPQRTQSLSSIPFKPNPPQLQTGPFNSYPTPSRTVTPTSTTSSSPYNQSIPLPITRNNISLGYNGQHSPNTSAAASSPGYAATTLATATANVTTSPPILPGAVNGWNNFPVQPQLPPPALPPSVVANVMYTQHQHFQQQQQQVQRHAHAFRPSMNHQQQMYQHSQTHPSQSLDSSRTPCHVAESIISQFHPDAMNDPQIRQEICPTPSHGHTSYSHQQQRRSSDQHGTLMTYGPDDGVDFATEGTPEHDVLNMSGMDLGDTEGQRCGDGGHGGCVEESGVGSGEENSDLMACSVDNVVLLGVLNRIT